MISPFGKRKRGSRSLRLATVVAMVFGIALALLSFVVCEVVANTVINRVYLSEENKAEREKEYARELQEYVDERGLSSEDTRELAAWAQSNRYLYVMIYKDDMLLFETGDEYEDENQKPPSDEQPPEDNTEDGDGSGAGDPSTDTDGDSGNTADGDNGDGKNDGIAGGITVTPPSREDLIKYAEEKEAHLITLSDASVLVSMADYTEYLYYDMINILSIVLAVIVLFTVIFVYSFGLTRRIGRLAKEVTVVASGDMNHAIRPDGEDEIGKLSRDVENMRSAILENLAKEKAALDANAELVTSMSHDLRTPLTVLLGYLDIMKLHATDESMRSYIKASEKTVMRLKTLSDDMFGYFLLFGGKATEMTFEVYDAYTLFDQMLSEHVLLLTEKGYTVDLVLSEELSDPTRKTRIKADAPILMRVIDNVFSNLSKYADKAYPVSITVCRESGKIKLTVSNKISQYAGDVESNGIGLKTCRKLCEMLGYDFVAEVMDGEFIVLISANEYIEKDASRGE